MKTLRTTLVLLSVAAMIALLLMLPSAASAAGLNTTRDLTISKDFSGNINIKDGTLTVAGGASVRGNIEQTGPGGVVIESGAFVVGNIREQGAGNVEVYGYLRGNIEERDLGDVVIDLPEDVSFHGNIKEQGAGNVMIWAGTLRGNIEENGDGSLIVEDDVSLSGRVKESGAGDLLTAFTVSFVSNGGAEIEPHRVISGQALGILPVPNRPGFVFLGWYADDNSFEQGVAEHTLVTSDLTLYARYAAVAGVAEAHEDMFASAMDCEPDLAIDVLSSDASLSSAAVRAALRLEVLDGSPFAGLSVSGGDGAYTVTAGEGYTPGSSYKLTLTNAALSFKDEPGSVRTYCFTIKDKAPVMNLRVDSDVVEISAGAVSNMTVDGLQTSGLSVPLASIGSELSDFEDTGTFTYTGSEAIAVGDVLAINMGTPLDQRDPTVDYSDEPVAYVEVIATDGSTVTYRTAEAQDVLFVPDVLPVEEADILDGDRNNHSITIAVADMTYTGEDFAEAGLDADTVVETGDFLAFYAGGEDPVGYARIDTVRLSGGWYTIACSDVGEDELAAAMDLSSSFDASPDPAEDIDIQAMEADIERQVVESGFADAAARYLTGLAQETDGFQTLDGAALMSQAGGESDIEVSKPKVVVEISPVLEHFEGLNGLRCAVTVAWDVACGEDMKIHLSGTFVEEVRTTLKASGGAVWKTKKAWIFRIPYIADYKMNASVDVYNFTGIDVKATLTTSEDTLDIAQQIKDMMATESYRPEEISAETKAFYELYGDMLENEHDYVQIFSREIFSQESGIDPLHILAGRLSMDFVVNADVNLSLGLHFAYEKGTRYLFSLLLFAGKATSDQVDLIDESYNFQFYAMGTMGLRAGIVVRAELGLFTCKAGSIGIEAETGPYARLWGYFFYELDHRNDVTTSVASGALYVELGIYLHLRFLAQAVDGKYSYNPTLYEHEWPLWSVGSRQNVFDFSYVLTDATDDIHLKGDNTTYALPPSVFSMQRLDLEEGDITASPYSSTAFTFAFTNSSFSQANGAITVQKPVDEGIIEGYMTVYWGGGPLSFTTVPLSRTYHVVWDDLADSYMISFDSQGGSLVSAIVGPDGSAVTLPEPLRAGYTFRGWFDNEECSGDAYTAATMPAVNVQLFARWTAETDIMYTVRHYLQTVVGSGFELAVADSQTFTGTTASEVTPSVNAYPGFTSPPAQTVVINGDGSTVVEYYYARNSYPLTFKLGNGDPDIVRTAVYGALISAPAVTRMGYAFAAWHSDEALSSVYAFDASTTMPAGPLTLHAGWMPTEAQVAIRNELSSDGTAPLGEVVSDTVSLTWGAPSDNVPTGSIKVMMRTPSGEISVVYNQVIAPSTSPLSFMATEQELSELGLYQFWAEYIPDAESIFPGAVSEFAGVTVKMAVGMSTLLSSGVDAIVQAPAMVSDTITLTWEAPPGMVPTGSIRVTGKMPDGNTWLVCDEPITALTSPFVFTTTDQVLGTGEWWEAGQGVLGPGLYQFQAEYVPDADSVFVGAFSPYEDEQVTVIPVPPVYEWEEISETGTPLLAIEDAYYDDFTFGPLPVGFSFPFSGNTFDSFYVSTNGWISFTEPTDAARSPLPLPNLLAPFNLVAPFWDDLSVYAASQNIYYLYDGEKLIVEYKDVHYYGNIDASFTFEVFLYPDGSMVFQYQSMTFPREWATVGVQNGTGGEGLQIACSEAYIEDGLAVSIHPWVGGYTWADSLGRWGY